jgi:hypothetical protein
MVFKCLDDFDTSPSISYADPDLEGENSATWEKNLSQEFKVKYKKLDENFYIPESLPWLCQLI